MNTGDKPRATSYKIPNGYDVFHWPEFQALAKRLMIDLGPPITRVVIDVGLEDVVNVRTESYGLDATKEVERKV